MTPSAAPADAVSSPAGPVELWFTTAHLTIHVPRAASAAGIPGALPPQAAPTEAETTALVEGCHAHGFAFRGPPVA